MRIFKKHAMSLVALAIAATSTTLMSFDNEKSVNQLRWFTVEHNGTNFIYSSSNPPMGNENPQAGCENEIDDAPLCSVAFPDTEINPTTGLPNQTNPELADSENKRYQTPQ